MASAVFAGPAEFHFGAVVDGSLVRLSPQGWEAELSVFLGEQHLLLESPAWSRTLDVRLSDVQRALVDSRRRHLVLVLERFPRCFRIGDLRRLKEELPEKAFWTSERALVITPHHDGWLEPISSILPVVTSNFSVSQEHPPDLPKDLEFGVRFLLQVVQGVSHQRLNASCIEKLLALNMDELMIEVAGLVEACQIDILTQHKPLDALVGLGGTGKGLISTSTMKAGHLHVVRQCDVSPVDVVCRFPCAVETKRLLEVAEDHKLMDFLIVVAFVDMTGERMSHPTKRRAKQVLEEGLMICGRRYRFLAASSDQLRKGGAWFLCEDNPQQATVVWLRAQLGDFAAITNPTKFLCRLGMSLSTSRPAFDVQGLVDVVDDISHDGHCFTDGCGEMSREVAERVAAAFSLKSPPSAIQIRLGGAKGVLVVNHSLSGARVVLRKSMVKFGCDDTVLRLVSVAHPGPLFLNHDVLTVLGPHVSEYRWHEMLNDTLLDIARLLYASDLESIPAHIRDSFLSALAPAISTAAISASGLNVWNDSLCLAVMRGVYVGAVMNLCERMHIPVREGVMLMGVADPSGILLPHEVVVACNGEQCEGRMLVCRFPLNHPGDLRWLTAVRRPELSHLRDVLVFSTKPEAPGAQPQFAKCGGGDLDGDLYAVFFDLAPTVDLRSEDGRSGTDALALPLDLAEAGIKDFVKPGASSEESTEAEAFLRICLNDVLGQACNMQKALADRSRDGAYDEDCLKLAALAYVAVDSPKTGDVVEIPAELRAAEYPDWMLNSRKPVYASSKILGQLFRAVKDLNSVSILQESPVGPMGDHNDVAFMLMSSGAASPGTRALVDETHAWYKQRVQLALAGWGLSSEVELLVGPLRKKLTKFDLRRESSRTEKTRLVLEQICEESADRFDAILAEVPLLNLAEAWWQVDPDSASAFRWVPWRRHHEELCQVVVAGPLHRHVSLPLACLGREVLARAHPNGRGASLREPLAAVLHDFLASELMHTFELHLQNNPKADVLECTALCARLMLDNLSMGDTTSSTTPEEADLSQEDACGRQLVALVMMLPVVAKTCEPEMSIKLKKIAGEETAKAVSHIQRLLRCHAYRLPVRLSLASLFDEPMHFHQQLYALSAKQTQLLAVTKVFAQHLRQSSGAQVHVRTSERGHGRRPVRSLFVSGTLAQLVLIERELDRLERTPLVRSGKFEGMITSVRFDGDVAEGSLVAFADATCSINPVHQRRGSPAYELLVDPAVVSGGYRGGQSLENLLARLGAEPFEMLELSVKLGSFYCVGPPDPLLGPRPRRQLTAREAADLLAGCCPDGSRVGVELLPGTSGRGRGRKPFIISYLKSGFNGSLRQAPPGFRPARKSLTAKILTLPDEVPLSYEAEALDGRPDPQRVCVSRGERRVLMYTEISRTPARSPWRGDLRVSAGAHIAVGRSEDLHNAVVADPPLVCTDGEDKEWYRCLRANASKYTFETIRAHHIMEKPLPGLEGAVFEVDRVVSLLPAGTSDGPDGLVGVAVESDLFEVSVRLAPVLGTDLLPSQLHEELMTAISTLRAEAARFGHS